MDFFDSRTRFALEATRQAAILAATIQRKMASEAFAKADRSPVTVADFAAQAVIGYLLDQDYPEDRLVGEEQSDFLRQPEQQDVLTMVTGFVKQVVPQATSEQVCDFIDRGGDQPGRRYWTLDPIDGTKGFLRSAQYATALAYVEDGLVQLGVLGCPNLTPDLKEASPGEGSLLIASRGNGCWIAALQTANLPGQFTRLSVSQQADHEQARVLRSFESGHTNTDQIDAFQKAFGTKAEPVRMDSQVKYALLAAGQGELYLRLLSRDKPQYKEKVWDQAAGSLLVEEAGGIVTDLDGKALDFSQGKTLRGNRGICASNGVFHPKAIEILQAVKA